MAKQQAGSSNALYISFLKMQGYLRQGLNWASGTVSWTNGWGENVGRIAIAVKRTDGGTPQERTCFNLRYTHTNNWSGEKADLDYNVELTTTPCRYGGKRYWFVCPLSKNGVYCGRRVAVLYLIGKWYGCRHCGDLCYASQLRGGKYRGTSFTCPDTDKLKDSMKRWYYRGQPTRKHRRLIKMNDKIDYAFALMGARFGFKDFQSLLDDTEHLQNGEGVVK